MTFFLVRWVDDNALLSFTRLFETREEATEFIIQSKQAKQYADTVENIKYHLKMANAYPAGLISGVNCYFELLPITLTKKVDGVWPH